MPEHALVRGQGLMQVLLDECVSEQLRQHLPGHECQTARYAALAGLEKGELLREQKQRGFEYQQNLTTRCVAVILYLWKSQSLFEDLLPQMPTCLEVDPAWSGDPNRRLAL